jgi:hypothetical protein
VGSRLTHDAEGRPVVVDNSGRRYRIVGNHLKSVSDGIDWLGKAKTRQPRQPTAEERLEADTDPRA